MCSKIHKSTCWNVVLLIIRFFKLFISLLEEKYAASNNPEVRTVIQNQFQGKCKYVTTCKGCNSSKNFETSFYEVELSVKVYFLFLFSTGKGHSTIEECLNEYLKEEQLTEENQYYCDVCNSKKDATRAIVLSQLPEVTFFIFSFIYNRF